MASETAGQGAEMRCHRLQKNTAWHSQTATPQQHARVTGPGAGPTPQQERNIIGINSDLMVEWSLPATASACKTYKVIGGVLHHLHS